MLELTSQLMPCANLSQTPQNQTKHRQNSAEKKQSPVASISWSPSPGSVLEPT